METTRVTDALAARFVACMPRRDPEGKRVSIALYRLLAEGRPVPHEQLANGIGVDRGRVEKLLRSWPGVFFDEEGSV